MVSAKDKARSDLRRALDSHFRTFPDSPLRSVMTSADLEDRLASFDQVDAIALREQKSYRRFGRFALWAMLTGTIVGAVALLPMHVGDQPRRMLEAVQGLAMILTFIAVIWIGLKKPVGQWMHSRAEAERIRADVFRAIIRAGTEVRELLAPALDCFKEAHLGWQLDFYKRRGQQHRHSAGHITPYRVLGYLLLFAALWLGFAGLVSLAAEFGWSWSPLTLAVQWMPLERPGSWQLGLGVIASSILAFASARSYMDQNDRNGSCYALAAAELEALRRDDLPAAEAAAGTGDIARVLAFCEKVQSVLAAEHGAWIYARPPENVTDAPKPKV